MNGRTFRPKDWDRFQHYKKRAPAWIKFYPSVLDDPEIGRLDDRAKAHLFAIWLLAARSGPDLPFDAGWVAGRINATSPVDLETLAHRGFLVVDPPLASDSMLIALS